MTKTKEELKKNKKKRDDEDSDDESSISEASKGDMDSGGSGKIFSSNKSLSMWMYQHCWNFK